MIPESELLDGIRGSIENGDRLRDDGIFLYETKRYLSAHLLFALAVEEYGKAILLFRRLAERRGFSNQEYMKYFLNHAEKISAILNYFVDETKRLSKGEKQRTKEDFRKMGLVENTAKLETLYVDWREAEQRWSIPTKFPSDEAYAQANEAKRVSVFSRELVKKELNNKGIDID